MDNIVLDDAMYLFILPRTLGATADGEPVLAAIGRFGPYIKYGSKYVSLKDDDPYTVSFEKALEVIAAKQLADANRIIHDFGVDKIQVLNGRYGPYISDGAKNARMPKGRDPKSLTLEECRELLAAAPAKGTRGRFGRKLAPAKAAADKAPAAAKKKVSVPKVVTPKVVTPKAATPKVAAPKKKAAARKPAAPRAAASKPPAV
jgi:DNA topoisomerase I